MDQSLWRELPVELLEQVLPFLLVPHLCKFRIVCKRWNNLICSREFRKLCVLNASKRANDGGFLVVNFRRGSEDELPRWSILDVDEKRWYKPTHDLPRDFADNVAMDGGLVCAFLDSSTEKERREASHWSRGTVTDKWRTLVLFNLFGGATKVLPNPPSGELFFRNLKLKLIVDNSSNTFKICVINRVGSSLLHIYESSTGQWRKLPNPPDHAYEWRSPTRRIAIFQGLLYVLRVTRKQAATLCSFNFTDNSWEDTGVQFRLGVRTVNDLVVSDNRLFLITNHSHRSGWALDISEIFLADKECRTVVPVRESERLTNVNFRSNDAFYARAFGFNKSILLMSNVDGRVMLYKSLRTGWKQGD